MPARLCDVSWCLAVVETGRRLCAIHQRFGQGYQTLIESERCDTCRGTRLCDACDGSGNL